VNFLLAAGEGDHEPSPLNVVWSEVILVLIVFGLLFFLVKKYVVPAFEKNYAARTAAIEGGIEQAQAAQEQAQRMLEQYQQQLAEVRVEAAQIRENARAEGQRIVEELRTQAQEESARIVARGDEQLASQRAAVVRELRAEIGSLAVELSEKIVDQRLADDAQVSATVDAFLAGLEARDAAGSES
jgi:F-type H+-transporting ATPase subunit b